MCPKNLLKFCLVPMRPWLHWSFAWQLASDREVRQQSLDGAGPTFWKHLRWMWRWCWWPWPQLHMAHVVMVGQPTKQLWQRAGLVRVGWDEGLGAWEVHIALCARIRGQGLGTMVLGHVGQVLNKQKPKLPILAHIKPGNQGSVRAFEKAGFVLRGASPEGLLQLEYRPVVAVLDNGKGAVH